MSVGLANYTNHFARSPLCKASTNTGTQRRSTTRRVEDRDNPGTDTSSDGEQEAVQRVVEVKQEGDRSWPGVKGNVVQTQFIQHVEEIRQVQSARPRRRKTAITEPGRRRQPAVLQGTPAVLPGHVQQEPQPVPDHVHPHQQQAQPWVQEDCPGQGIVSDMPDMIIPAAEKGHGEVHDGGQRQDDVPVGQGQGVHSPRRSTRAGRGQTNKYKDFVRLTESGASATYAQMVSGMGGRGHSW